MATIKSAGEVVGKIKVKVSGKMLFQVAFGQDEAFDISIKNGEQAFFEEQKFSIDDKGVVDIHYSYLSEAQETAIVVLQLPKSTEKADSLEVDLDLHAQDGAKIILTNPFAGDVYCMTESGAKVEVCNAASLGAIQCVNNGGEIIVMAQKICAYDLYSSVNSHSDALKPSITVAAERFSELSRKISEGVKGSVMDIAGQDWDKKLQSVGPVIITTSTEN